MKTARLTLTAVLAGVLGIPAFSAEPQPTPADQAFNLRMDGKSDEAKTLLKLSLGEDEKDASAWFEMARIEFYHAQLDDAAGAIAKAIQLAPENARYHYLAGVTAAYNAVLKHKSPETRNQVDTEMGKALAAFERAVDLDPDYHDARIQLINMLLKAPQKQGGDRAKAQKHVEMLESKAAVYGVEGRCMLDDAASEKAIKLWEKVVASHSARADAHAGLAKSCLFAGDIDLAVTHIDEAIRLDPSCRTLLLALCRQYVSQNDYAGAQKAVDRYLDPSPPPPAPMRSFATYYLAVLQKRQGNGDRADALMAEAKTLDPHCWMFYMEPPQELFESP